MSRLKKVFSCIMVLIIITACFSSVKVSAKTLSEAAEMTVAFGEFDTVSFKKDEITTLEVNMTERGSFSLDFTPKTLLLGVQLYDELGNEITYSKSPFGGRGETFFDVVNFSGLEPGKYYVRLWCNEDKEYTFFAKCKPSDDVSFEIGIVLEKKDTIQLDSIMSNVKDIVKWSSTKKKVASVDANGKVKALKKGKTVIKAYTQSGLVAKITVRVK